MNSSSQFRIGVTRDFLNPDGALVFGGIGLGSLESLPGISVELRPDYGGKRPASIGPHFDA